MRKHHNPFASFLFLRGLVSPNINMFSYQKINKDAIGGPYGAIMKVQRGKYAKSLDG